MADTEKNATEQKDLQYFDKMLHGAKDIIDPFAEQWKLVVKWLVIALVASNLIWATIHGYSIYKAYQEPSTYEQKQDQKQLFENKEQLQNNSSKGSVN